MILFSTNNRVIQENTKLLCRAMADQEMLNEYNDNYQHNENIIETKKTLIKINRNNKRHQNLIKRKGLAFDNEKQIQAFNELQNTLLTQQSSLKQQQQKQQQPENIGNDDEQDKNIKKKNLKKRKFLFNQNNSTILDKNTMPVNTDLSSTSYDTNNESDDNSDNEDDNHESNVLMEKVSNLIEIQGICHINLIKAQFLLSYNEETKLV